MKAARFGQFGGPEVLEIDALPDPHAGPVQIRVTVRAAGINPTDWKVRKGMMGGKLPQTTGREVAGVVDEIGEGVTDVKVGARVFGFSDDAGVAADL
jgi:NADPH:quinone reductase-like Zn-dependent oxidoreductase